MARKKTTTRSKKAVAKPQRGVRTAKQEFDAARFRRRTSNWLPTANNINSIMALSGDLLRRRARDAIRNNAHAVAAIENFCSNLIGAGIKPSPLLENAEQKKALQTLWNDWTEQCDADGVQDFYGMQTLAGRALFEAGECFIRFRPRRVEDGLAVPLQLQMLESDMLPYEKNETAENGNTIRNGIEFDFIGRRTAYHFRTSHPGDMATTGELPTADTVAVPANQVLHIYRVTRPGQIRGVPMLTPALVRMFFLDAYDDAEVERKKTAAMYAAFVTSPTPDDIIPTVNDGTEENPDIGLAALEPGTLQTLLPGEDIKFSAPADVGSAYEMFQYRQLLAIFSAMGVPYTLVTGDLKRANYSSIRGAIVEYRRKLEQLQHNVIVFQMCRPVYQRFVLEASLSGAVATGGYGDALVNYSRCKWITPRFEWVDPLKDRQAEKLAVDSGFKSRSDVIEAEGYDPEEVDARIAADKKREEQLDLAFPNGITKREDGEPSPAPGQPPGATDGEEEAQDAEDDAAEDAAAADAA